MLLNYVKTAVLLAILSVILVTMGYVVGGESGALIALVVALGMNVFSYWNSDKMVLRLQNAQEVDAQSGGQFYEIVRGLAAKAGLPMPRVYIMRNPQPNAFATGRNPEHAAVVASTGLLELLTPEEVTGVISHELAHVKSRDTLIMTVAATIGGAISLLANYLQFAWLFGGRRNNNLGVLGTLAAILLFPFAAMLVQMAISRSREYQADRLGAEISGHPLWLASALEKISEAVKRIPNPDASRVPAMAHLFIINPLSGRATDSLFSTHPSTQNRIAELVKLAAEMGQTSAQGSFLPGAARAMLQQGGGPGPMDSGGRPWG